MKKIIALLCTAMLPLVSLAKEKPIVIVQIENAQEVAQDIAKIAETLGMPIPPQMILGGLGGSVMNPGLTGIDLSQSIQLFIGQPDLNNPQQDTSAFSFSVEGDGSSYIEAVKLMMPSHELTEGIHHFAMQLPDGSSNDFFVQIAESRATASPNRAALNALDHNISPQQQEIADSLPGGVSLMLDGPVVSDMVIKQMEVTQEMLTAQQAGMKEAGLTNQVPFDMDTAAVMKSYQDMLSLASDQVETFALSIDLKNDISIYSHLRAKAESTFEKIISERGVPTATVTAFDSPESIFRLFGSLKGCDHILEPYGEFIGTMYSAMGPPFSELADEYQELMTNLTGLYNGGYNFLLLPPSEEAPLQFAGIYEISDKTRMQTVMNDMMKKFSELKFEEDNPMSMEMKVVSTENYNGVEIQNMSMKYEMPTEGMPEGYPNLFTNMTYQFAYVGDYMLYTSGADELMHKTIDHAQKTDHQHPNITGYEDIQEPIIEYWNINLAQAIATFSSLIPTPEGGPDLAALGAVQAGLSGISYNQNNGITSLTRIKAEELMGFMSMGMMMQPAPAVPEAPPSF